MSNAVEQATEAGAGQTKTWRPSLFSLIVTGFVVGVACGLFFGDYTAGLQVVGDIYVGLLQMTVLPYIVFSLIGSIGRLSLTEGKRLAFTAVSVLAILWAIGCITVGLTAFSFPRIDTGAFFSTSLLEPVQGVDLVELFVPSNPFRSLSNNIAPAVVVFCILFGVALVRVRGKEDLLKVCDTIVATLSRVNGFIVAISPIGIFAISATAAGTLTLHEFGRLQAYLLAFALSVALLTFWVLPMLIAACTPFRYRDILAASKSALFTAFVVGSLFVVIPMLAEGVRQLIEKYRKEGLDTSIHPEFVIPLGYPFPHLGKVLTLIFIPFAAWFYGKPMAFTDYPVFLGTGLVLSFGKVTTTIPFLLDLQKLPSDIFQLFLLSSVFAGGVSDLIGGMHLMAFTTLTTCAMAGLIKIKRIKLIILIVVAVALGSGMIGATRMIVAQTSDQTDRNAKLVAGMELLRSPVPVEVLKQGAPNPVPLKPGQSRLDRIRERKAIRIGFSRDDLPFSYFNTRGKLVGFDIDMAYSLAADLGVGIEFVPFASPFLVEQMENDHFDIAMSGTAVTARRASQMWLSEPYMDLTLALVVRDHDEEVFSDIERIRRLPSLSIGYLTGEFFKEQILDSVPRAKIVELQSESQFFESPPEHIDALLTSAEGGSAWTLLHPEFQVVNPMPRRIRLPVAYPYAGPDPEFRRFLNAWVHEQAVNGTVEELYDHWILGRGAETRDRRWSLIRDVLHWVD